MSGRIPKEFISDLLQRCDVVEVINSRVPLTKRGANHVACCPFHNEKTPSFTVSETKQFYHCFGCGVSGNAINFLMEFDRLSFVEAIEMLAKQIGLEVPRLTVYASNNEPADNREQIYDLMDKISKFYQLKLSQFHEALEYLYDRGINKEVIEAFGLGYAPPGWRHIEPILGANSEIQQVLLNAGMLVNKAHGQPYDRFRDRIMFPIRDRQGRIIAFGGRTLGTDTPKYLNSPETPIFHKGHELYGLYEAKEALRDASNIIVVEGYMDVIALAQYGIRNTAATLGTAATQEHIHRLLRASKEVIFCFDGDRAGRKAAWRALNNAMGILKDGVVIKFMFLPDGEDPDSIIRKEGVASFIKRTNEASSLSDYLFDHLLKQVDLGTIDGKAEFCALCKPIIKKLNDSAFKHMLLQQIAKLLRVNEDKLPSMLGIEIQPQPSAQMQAQESPIKAPSPIRSAITMLLQNPQLVQSVTNLDELRQQKLPGMAMFIKLVELVRDRPNINTAVILEYFSDHPQAETLKKLAMWEQNVPETGLKEEFTDILKRLQHNSLDQQMEQLLNKANLEGLSNDERNQLQQLITEKHTD